ncbi:1,4-alpha-glucan branching enzyme [Bacillus sp. M6-12]|uniref:1,4-alpha-glucan branching enzyme n=1 Tax=Bacillus sp. M6-12 TaxID=2054166 RepID=UPI000C7587E9|nr:1,4-alpha-glucan branching enzyme [Bacillus sp. M6-12]PLS14968.1 1,4-alpha-glucan branching enzyme [Bacillus sp. M6-12]
MVQGFPTDYEIHLFHEGNLNEAYNLFGSHLVENGGTVHTRFCVWAPHARKIRLTGSFNSWDPEGYDLTRINNEGIWFITVPFNATGALYKYEIESEDGKTFLKADPYACYAELRPNTASIVHSLDGYVWQDRHWQRKKKSETSSSPIAIYELHFGSWKLKKDGILYSYREMADEIIPYVKERGFNFIEILPLIEHPFDLSWGYQGTGYFAPTSRYGTPQDFMYFIDRCHQSGIGVILDWVPGHFCKDAHGLYMFDGKPLYEYRDQQHRENLVWGTANFDLGKTEVQSFLISNARYWIEHFHIDGFRVDAVANIIFWPGGDGGYENPYAISFLQKLNETVKQYNPNFLMMAEDSTDWPNVTSRAGYGGLGFDYKWNMGWMNDVLTYMEAPPDLRSSLHHKLTFSLMYAFSENFILPLSHDEVVHGKKSLLDKMPGQYEEKFSQLRLLYGYMMAHPGKKLLFMGGEFGQFAEWKDKEQLDWNLLEYGMHQKMDAYTKELLFFYKRSKALYELDNDPSGFQWIDVHNNQQSVLSFIRRGKKEEDFLVIVCNFRNHAYSDYKIGVPQKREYREVLNSDRADFGGSGHVNKKVIKSHEGVYHGNPFYITMNVPPYGISILRPVQKRKGQEQNGKDKMRSNVIGGGKGKQA